MTLVCGGRRKCECECEERERQRAINLRQAPSCLFVYVLSVCR